MLNTIIIVGRLVKNPELRKTSNDIPVASFRIACDRDYKDKDGNKIVDFLDVVAWRATGEFITKYFKQGDMITLKGRMETRNWQDKDGNKRTSYEINVETAHFAGSKRKESEATTPALEELENTDDELPF